ncbi:MAG TPA: YciI family protein, partial [Polyangiaceae bacterium]|nr:YciI family protein [Polyangiaceae bacterium]
VTQGPYSGANELVDSFAMIRATSLEEAVERAREFARVLDAEIEVGPVVEPWDLGVMPKPTGNTPGRFLLLCKGDATTEAGGAALDERRAKLAALIEALKKEGVLLMSDRLAPSARGARLAAASKVGTIPGVGASPGAVPAAASKPKRSWVDGPFAESKELIAGFSVLDLPSKADAIAWADRYAAVLGDNEVDVREME